MYMIELKVQYPFIDDNRNENDKLIKHYAEDGEGKRYRILQNETGIEYDEAIDVYPCRYTYSATDEPIEE